MNIMKKLSSQHTESFHSLIAQASEILHSLTASSNAKWFELREQAQILVQIMDGEYPNQSNIQQVLALVRQLAYAQDKDYDNQRRLAQQFIQELKHESLHSHGKPRKTPASTRDVDRWILDMFRATESAIPRETLVYDFVQRYRQERGVLDDARYNGPWLFVFAAETAQNHIVRIKPLEGCGLHPDAFKRHCDQFLSEWQSDPFLSRVFVDQHDIELWFAMSFSGSSLFDGLLDCRRRFHGESNYWLSAVTLPGDHRHPTQALFILYRNAADPLFPEPPSGSRQDMRLLTVLGLAWRQLEHQVKALANISESDRRDLINQIAPGLLHHEIGVNMRSAYGQAYEQFHLLQKIVAETGREDIELAVRYSHTIANLVLNLYKITDAFNNLDKRGQVESTNLDKVFSDIRLLLHHRLGHAFTELLWDQQLAQSMTLETDVVLLTQAIINIINNALNALTEAETPPPRRIQVLLTADNNRIIDIFFFNNGPPITETDKRDIFRRGYTTRRHGHGQGLYLARLVAHYLGGELVLLPNSEAPNTEFNVGFRLTLDRHLPTEHGLARNAD
jgi:signal transduction histidine kinase